MRSLAQRESPGPGRPPRRGPAAGGRVALLALALAVATLALYWQVRHFGFVTYDDPEYVSRNEALLQGFSPAGVSWAFTTFRGGNWHPVTWLSHLLDRRLFGPGPAGPHLVNALLHAANAALLLVLLRELTGALWRSSFVAALFALHPLRVESVAWVAERKDVLGVFFWVLATLAYVAYVRRRGAGRYLLCVALLALGLMSKATLVTLPLTLLLLDVWPLGRLRRPPRDRTTPGRLLAEKAPLLALAAVTAALTLAAPMGLGAVDLAQLDSLGARVANALVSTVAYLGKTAWPTGLAVIYPYPTQIPPGRVAGAALAIAALTSGAAVAARRSPWLLAGWLWYLVVLAPVSGVVQVGLQAMADRYTYVPLIGIFVAVTWEAEARTRSRPRARAGLAAAGVAALLALTAASWRQIGVWRDSATLFRHAVAVTEGNYVAHANLAHDLWEQGRDDEAEEQTRLALGIRPDYAVALNNLGFSLARKGRYGEALAYLERAVRSDPADAGSRRNLGYALVAVGRVPEALGHFRVAYDLAPERSGEFLDLARALVASGDAGGAAAFFRELSARSPDDPALRLGLGIALLGAGRAGEALPHLEVAAAGRPRDAEAHHDLGLALLLGGDAPGAAASFRRALAADPGHAPSREQLLRLAPPSRGGRAAEGRP